MPELTCANTFMIGAQKSGTTYLASLLGQSTDVCVSDPKESQFFSTGFDAGFETYSKCFANPSAKIRLDASTTYSFLRPHAHMDIPDAPGLLQPVPQRIKDACPEARFIYIMRDPVKRAMSAVRHHARTKALSDKQLSLLDCFNNDPMLPLIGRYSAQIERYLEVFPKERFLFLDFNDLKNNPLETLDKTRAFLGIEKDGFVISAATGEKHQAYEYTGIGRLTRRVFKPESGLTDLAKTLIPKPLRSKVVGSVMTRPSEIEFHDQDAAAALFEADRARVFELTGLRI